MISTRPRSTQTAIITTTNATFSSTQTAPKSTARTRSTPIPSSFLIAALCLILASNNNNVSASTFLSTTTTTIVQLSSPLAPRSFCSQTAPSQRILQRQRLARQQRQQRQRQGRGQSQQEQELSVNGSTALSSTSPSSSLSPPVYPPCNQQQEQRLVVSSLSCSCSLTPQDHHHRHQQITTQQQPQRQLAKRQTIAASEQQNNDQVSQQDANTFPVNSLPLEADTGIGGSSNSPSNANNPRDSPKMASSEKVLIAFIAVAVALAVFTLGFCLIKARRKSAAERTQLPMQQQRPQQPQQQQQQQPQMQHRLQPQQQHQQQQQQQQQQSVQAQHMLSDHNTATLSTFTRISPAGPEMSALLSSAKASESRAGGFSLVRLLTKHSSSGGTSSKPRVYQFSHSRSGKDPSLQKTPSTRSSNYDYDWDLSDFSKERSKDGFPVIILTSPTSSEVSIPFISLDEQPASTSSSSAFCSTNLEPRSLSPLTTIPPATTTTTRTENHSGDEIGSAPTNSNLAPAPLPPPQQSIPEHMLLHPSSSINIHRLVKQEPVPPTSSPSIADFPPTYEEALDSAGPSNRSPMTSPPNVSSHSSLVSTSTSPSYSGSSSSSLSRPTYLNGLDSTSHSDTSSIEGAQDGSVDIETDPLASLSLSYTA